MNFGGMGTLEVLFILLIAFIFLGPQRMGDAAKTLGKLVRDLRRMTADLPELVLDEDDKPAKSPIVNRRSGHVAPPKESGQDGRPVKQPEQSDDRDPGTAAEDGPMAFRPAPITRPERS